VLFEGHMFHRFMDFIYLPAMADDLTRDQLISVNRLRKRLVGMSLLTSANARVKERLADAVHAIAAGSVLEWGCGYQSIEPLLPADLSYTAVDIDPGVVHHHAVRGTRCFLADELPERVGVAQHDVVVSAFVFHFDIPDHHIAALHRLLSPEGLIIANVYRRAGRSRAQLRDAFAAKGFELFVEPDPDRLCKAHEYWVLQKKIERSKTRMLLPVL
jgi:SAM-dependent methyltransferase